MPSSDGSRKRPAARRPRASTWWRCTAPTATWSASSSRRTRTAAPTSTAATSSGACASPSRSSPPSAEAVGAEVPVLYRLSADEHVPGGLTIDDVCEIVPRLERAGVDLFDVSAGIYESAVWIVQPMEMRARRAWPRSAAASARARRCPSAWRGGSATRAWPRPSSRRAMPISSRSAARSTPTPRCRARASRGGWMRSAPAWDASRAAISSGRTCRSSAWRTPARPASGSTRSGPPRGLSAWWSSGRGPPGSNRRASQPSAAMPSPSSSAAASPAVSSC